MFFDYHRQHRFEIKVARIFNTFGPRMHPEDGRVVSNFIGQALSGKPLTVYGDGSQTRSFCYVSDLVDALVKLMESPAAITGPTNLGNPREFTMLELANVVRRISGSSSPIEFRPLPQDDPKQRRPGISRARDELGWTPTVTLEDGLQRTIAYFRSVPHEFAATGGPDMRVRMTSGNVTALRR
jgi:UDP-glucuronate decarboxylase